MDTVDQILIGTSTIAMVGLSPDPTRDSHRVARYLKTVGYRVVPVNPTILEVLGEKSYPDLKSVPEPIDMVDIFRRSEDVPPVVEQAIQIGAKYVWMQDGIVNETAAAVARAAGLSVVMNKCTMREHRHRFGG